MLAFFLIGLASAQATSTAAESGNKSTLFLALIVGLIVLCAGVVLIAPTCLALLARAARRAPIVVRLALRDMARYRARSGAALGAITLSVLIAVIICVTAAARFGNVVDYVGPNLASNQLIAYPQAAATTPGAPCLREPSGCPVLTGAQLAAMAAQADGIAASLGTGHTVQLESTDSSLQSTAPGRSWDGPVYVATPQLLRAYGIAAAHVSPGTDILTMRPGLSSLAQLQFLYGATKFGPPGSDSACPPSYCLQNPKIEQVSALPSGTSAPNTVITEHAVRQFHLTVTTAGWIIQTPDSLTPGQVSAAQHAAAVAGLTVETRNSVPTSADILDAATLFGILLALGILAMSVGLLRSETASDLRILTATGAGRTARRAISAATAGALALTGAVVGIVAGYVAAIGFFRTSQLDTLSSLTSVPVANLLFLLVGMPLIAVIGGWLLAGREPRAIGRAPPGVAVREPAETAGSRSDSVQLDLPHRFVQGTVDVLWVDVELPRLLLLCPGDGAVDRLLDLAFADDDERSLARIDEVAQLLRIRAGHALGQVSADSADDAACGRGAEDGRREDDTHGGSGGDTPPGTVAGGCLVLVLVHLAVLILGDHGRIVGTDQAQRMRLLDDPVVVTRRHLVGVGRHHDEGAAGIGHSAPPCVAG